MEAELKLEITKKLDTSKTSTVGGSYTTPYTLVADILVPLGHIYVGSNQRRGIPLEHREAFKSDGGKFYVDLANSRFHLCGTINQAETITFPYISKTPAIAANDSEVVVWPSDFHLLIAMEMAKIWYAIDQGEKSRSYAPEWQTFYTQLKNALIDWDAQWKLNAIGHATPYGDESIV